MVLISFLVCTITVGLYSLYKTKLSYAKTLQGLFFANRNNSFAFVGASLLLTNLSANQFIGENESVYINNLSVIGWGVTSVLAMLIVSEWLLPIYFRHGFTTIPDFLELRYDRSTKTFVSIIVLLSYIVNLLPPVLYGGAVALTTLFDVQHYFHLDYWTSIWVLVWALGLIASFYTIIGGMRLIAISDLTLGLGMLVLAIILPLYGFWHVGDGAILVGIKQVFSTHRAHLNAVGAASDAVPFSTLFTGMFLVNIYYWGMEQYIVQQALSAKNLAHAQKGMTFAAAGKLFMPLLINLPGLMAVHLLPGIEHTASTFPLLIVEILPEIWIGLTVALVFGAAITTYTAGLQSCGTLFILNIYKPLLERSGKKAPERHLVRASKRFEIVVSIGAMLIAPFILFAHTGFYNYLQTVSGFFSMPIFTIIVIGLFNKHVPPNAAKFGVIFFMLSYFVCEYILELNFHFLHTFALLFLLTSVLLLLWAKFFNRGYESEFRYIARSAEIKLGSAWRQRHVYATLLIICMVLIYLVFSPWGIAT